MVDTLCVVVLAIAVFSDGMAAWGGEFAKPHQGATTGRDYCYSGGQCFIDGVPVSGHP